MASLSPSQRAERCKAFAVAPGLTRSPARDVPAEAHYTSTSALNARRSAGHGTFSRLDAGCLVQRDYLALD